MKEERKWRDEMDAAFGETPETFHRRIEQTLRSLQAEQKEEPVSFIWDVKCSNNSRYVTWNVSRWWNIFSNNISRKFNIWKRSIRIW